MNVFRGRNYDYSIVADTWTPVPSWTEVQDTSAFHDGTTNPDRITIPTTGYYAVWAWVGPQVSSTSHLREARMILNGDTDKPLTGARGKTGNGDVGTFLQWVGCFTAGDYLTIESKSPTTLSSGSGAAGRANVYVMRLPTDDIFLSSQRAGYVGHWMQGRPRYCENGGFTVADDEVTVPATGNYLVMLTVNQRDASIDGIAMYVNGVDTGSSWQESQRNSDYPGSSWHHYRLIPLAAGDVVSFTDAGTPPGWTRGASIAIVKINEPCVAVTISAGGQTVGNGSGAYIDWDTEIIDTDGFHSTSSNISRITIPTGLGGTYLVGVRSSIDNHTFACAATIFVNHTVWAGWASYATPEPGDGWKNFSEQDKWNGILTLCQLSDGDYIEAWLSQDNTDTGSHLNGGAEMFAVRLDDMTPFDAVTCPVIPRQQIIRRVS